MNKIAALILLILFPFSSVASAAEQIFFYHTDPVGTPLAMTNASGQVVWRADYKPFGEENTVTTNPENNKEFVGKEKDEETGLYYFGARYLDAKVGRFTAADPVRAVNPHNNETNEKLLLSPLQLNIYAYGLNNPMKFVDSSGLSPTDRVNWAYYQLKNGKEFWEGKLWGKKNKCNEFVSAAHSFGDPDATHYPTVLRNDNYTIPTVKDLANPAFGRSNLDYLPYSNAKPGDIIIYYGKKQNGEPVHHSALYVGNDKVIYQNADYGVVIRTNADVVKRLGFTGTPIVRRYLYK